MAGYAVEPPWTVEKFDRWHAGQPERWELIDGVPIELTLRPLAHTMIKGNVLCRLAETLTWKPSQVYTSGVTVKERGRRLSAFPDLVAELAKPDFSSPEIANPVLIVEVVSSAAERHETERKLLGYRLVSSVRHIVVIEHDQPLVTVHSRTGPSAFSTTEHRAGAIDFLGLGASLPFDEIYRDVLFPEPESQRHA